MHEWLHDPASPPVTVPLDYLGIHSDHGVGLKTPAPSYPYDAVRSHDVDNGNDGSATQWADIEIKPALPSLATVPITAAWVKPWAPKIESTSSTQSASHETNKPPLVCGSVNNA